MKEKAVHISLTECKSRLRQVCLSLFLNRPIFLFLFILTVLNLFKKIFGNRI